MNRKNRVAKHSKQESSIFSHSHFVANLGKNSVLVPLFWIAALIAFIKSLYIENTFGLVVALLLAAVNTLVAFYRYQDFARSTVIYLGSLTLLIYDQRPDNVVSFCFLAVALSFLVNDRRMMQRIPYSPLILIVGYAVTLIGVAFWSSKEIDVSVLYPELGCLVVVVLVFKELFLPRPIQKSQSLPVLNISDYNLTDREIQVLTLFWGGQSSKEIAAVTKVSDGHIRVTLSQIYAKLNVANGKELLMLNHSRQIRFGEKTEAK